MSDTAYDGILLGAGHNALVLQAYLGKAGLKTLCLERAPQPGGGLATLEDAARPGFLHNTHSFFHRAITEMPWYRDLELERRGARYLEPELNVALVLRDGRVLEWWTDFERTAASFERFSAHDAQALRRWRDDFVPVLESRAGAATAGGPAPRRAGGLARGAAPARDERTLAAGVRAARIRASDDPGGAAVLQWTARGGPALQGLRAPHPEPAGC
jgi:phytoene dehydrogenase-like protein